MSKNKSRNPFYYFMVDYKEEQKSKGIQITMAEAAQAAGPLWQQAPPALRKKYEEIHKNKNAKTPVKKYTSTGILLSEIERQEQEQKEAIENERKTIRNIISTKAVDVASLYKATFYIIDVNAYCKVGSDYLIGESTILRFNIADGIMDNYHEIVNPGDIPMGYASDVKIGSKEFGLDMPFPDESTRSNYLEILAKMIDYLKQSERDVRLQVLPPVFTMPDKVEMVQDFINQLCSRAAEDHTIFRVYNLDYLFFNLVNALKTDENQGFPKESLALAQLKKDNFKYSPGLGCEHHEEIDMSIQCTLSRTRRWVYSVLDHCLPLTAVPCQPGRHFPQDYDISKILTYKEQKRERAGPSVQGPRGDSRESSCASSSKGAGPSVAAPAPQGGARKKVQAPLRPPTSAHRLPFSVSKPPELSEEDFPKLSAGRGRGAGLSSSFKNINLSK